MIYVVELIGGKILKVSEAEAETIDRAWARRLDLDIQNIRIPAGQISGIWPEEVWLETENDNRRRRGLEPLAEPQPAQPLLLDAGDKAKLPLSHVGKLWLDAIGRNKAAYEQTGKWGKWEVVDGQLSQTANPQPRPRQDTKCHRETKQFSPSQFSRHSQIPGYRIVNAENHQLEFTVVDWGNDA